MLVNIDYVILQITLCVRISKSKYPMSYETDMIPSYIVVEETVYEILM